MTTDISRETIARLAKSVQYSQGITGSNTILALRDALDAAERDRDNWKAHAISRGKRLRKTRDEFIGIKNKLCDEGDRVYFGSTNHADAFKDAVAWLNDFAWNKIMGEPENWDLLGALEKSRTALAAEREKVAKLEADATVAKVHRAATPRVRGWDE